MDRVERVATDTEGVWFKRVLRLAAAFAGDMAEVGAKCRGRKEPWIENGAERVTKVPPSP